MGCTHLKAPKPVFYSQPKHVPTEAGSGSHSHHSQANFLNLHAASLGTQIANYMSSHLHFSSYEAKGAFASHRLLETWQREIIHFLYQGGGGVINNTELCTRLSLIRANDEHHRAAPKPGASVSARAASRCRVERQEHGRARWETGQAPGESKLGPALLTHALPNGKGA